MSKPFDPSWVEKAKQGDQDAFQELYSYSYQAARIVIMTTIPPDEGAVHDLLQETFIKVYENLDQLKQPERFKAWVKQIARNTALDYMKKSKTLSFSELYTDDEIPVEIEDPEISHLPDMVVDKQETVRLVQVILATIPDAQRTVVSLYYFQEMPIKEIAATLGRSENTIKAHLFQGRKSMEAKIRDLEKKQDIKLRGVAPLSYLKLLVWGLEELTEQADPEILAAVIPEAVKDAAASVSAAVEAAKNAIAKKIAAGMMATATLAGGIVGYTVLNSPPKQPEKDLFAGDYAVTFSGENGEGIAHVHSLDGYGLDYEVEPGYALSNGDIVTLILSAPNGDDLEEYCAEYYGFVPTADSKIYIVTNLDE